MKNLINQIVCCDNIDGCRRIKDNSIDLVVTSPPYDEMRDYTFSSWCFDALVYELLRIVKTGGVVVWNVADQTKKCSETGTSFRQALKFMEVGFNLHDTMIYQKNCFAFPEQNRYHNVFEYMFVFSIGKPKVFNGIKDRTNLSLGASIHGTQRKKDGTTTPNNRRGVIQSKGLRFNVWEMDNSFVKDSENSHPAVMPYQMAFDHIYTWSNKGHLVLDPFMGSGTVAKAAQELGRQYIGFEISKEYTAIAKKRVSQSVLNI